MSATESELADLQREINQLQQKQTRAQIERENALSDISKAKDTLMNEFGVSTVQEAKALKARLETELEESLASVRAALTEAGA